MAKVVESYYAEMTNTGYIYDRPDISGEKTQYDYGQELKLPADYAQRETDGFYPVIYPENGWISYQIVGNITPNYKTTTDKCTAPTKLTINTAAKTLTIEGGSGGDLNTMTGFGISWRERDLTGSEWGSWSAETVSTGRTVNISVNAGKVRQYRVRTQGSAGESYYSDWVICSTLLSGNTAAKMPTILLPYSNAVTASKTPVVVISCGADAEGDQMTLQRSIDSESWMAVSTVAGTGGTVYDRLPSLGDGRHSIRYKLVDINNAESSVVTIYIAVSANTWSRDIASGDIISNEQISHINDINEMMNAVNVQRLYYGLPAITMPGTVGKFADWGKQMRAMLEATNACHAAAGQTVNSVTVKDVWPYAEIINVIRERILSI